MAIVRATSLISLRSSRLELGSATAQLVEQPAELDVGIADMVARRLVEAAGLAALGQMLDQGLLAADHALEQVLVAAEPVAQRGQVLVELGDGALERRRAPPRRDRRPAAAGR